MARAVGGMRRGGWGRGGGLLLFAAVLGWTQTGWGLEEEARTVLRLTLREFVGEVLRRNGKLEMSRLDAEIAGKQVENAQGDFEPRLVAGMTSKDDLTPNTVEESMKRSFLPEYYQRSNEYKLGVKKKVGLTGAQVEYNSTMQEINNNLQSGDSLQGEFKTFQGVNLTQPLLKGMGEAATAHVRLAAGDAEMAQEKGRLATLELMGQAISSYLDLIWAKKVLDTRLEAAVVSRRLLADGQNRVKAGRAAESDLLELLTLLSQREAQTHAARQALAAAEDALSNHLFIQHTVDRVDVEAIDALETDLEAPPEPASLESAFALRPELRLARKAALQEDVRLVYLSNQKLPQLDLVASYGLNGLAVNPRQAWRYNNDGRHESWSVGLQMEVPLLGGQSASSQMDAAQKRKEKALLEIKNNEVQIANLIHTQWKQVENGRAEWQTMQRLTRASREQWKVTLDNHEAGRGELRELLQQESLLKQSQEVELQTLLRYRKALLGLQLAEGSLLSRFGVEDGGAVPPPVSAAPAAVAAEHPELHALVRAWADAWAARDVGTYLAFYARGFLPDEGMSRSEWEERIRELFQGMEISRQKVERIRLRQITPERVEATFEQSYHVGRLPAVVQRNFILSREPDAVWRILEERTQPAPETPAGETSSPSPGEGNGGTAPSSPTTGS